MWNYESLKEVNDIGQINIFEGVLDDKFKWDHRIMACVVTGVHRNVLHFLISDALPVHFGCPILDVLSANKVS